MNGGEREIRERERAMGERERWGRERERWAREGELLTLGEIKQLRAELTKTGLCEGASEV